MSYKFSALYQCKWLIQGIFYVEIKGEIGGKRERKGIKMLLWKWLGYYIMSNINRNL